MKKRREYLRQWRRKNAVRYAWQTTKDNAKRRGKHFDLTLEQFEKFCRKYKYLVGKGKTKESLSIDCIINALGYTASNIRTLTVSENARKGTKVLEYDWMTRTARVSKREYTNEYYF